MKTQKHLILAAILLVSILIRVPSINSGFSQSDEFNDVYNALNIASMTPWEWLNPQNYGNLFSHGPFYAIILAFISNAIFLPVLLFLNVPIPLNNDILLWEHLTGMHIIEPFFRLISILFGVATIFLVFKLGKEFNYATGLIAAFILGTLSWHIYSSYLISPHGILSMITVLSLFMFYKGLKEEKNHLILYALALAGLGIYMNMLAIILPVIFIAYAFVYHTMYRNWLNSGIKAYLLVVSVPTLTFIATGGKWFLAVVKGAFFGALTPSSNDWMILWDPARGAFPSKAYPLLYINIFMDYLSPIILILLVIGILYSAYRVIRNKNKLDALMLIYLIVPFIILNLLTAKTPRYPVIILPVIAILSARAVMWFGEAISGFWKNLKYPAICSLLVLALISQPNLDNFVNSRYVIASEDAGIVYDPSIISDYINPRISSNDTVFYSGIKIFPWWYIKGDLIPRYDLDYSMNKTLSERPKFIIIEQFKRDIQGTGGGPVWLGGSYGKGTITLISFNASENQEYLEKLIPKKSRIGIISDYGELSSRLLKSGITSEKINPDNLKDLSNYDTLILYRTSEPERNLLNKDKDVINSFLEGGGSVIVIDPIVRYIDFLPLTTKVVTQVNKYPGHYTPIPQDRIFPSEYVSENIGWTSFFFDYDPAYKPLAFNSPVGAFLYEKYNLANVIRDPPTGWPLVEIYEFK